MQDSSSFPIVPALIIGIPLIALLWLIITSNRFTQLRNLLRESWSDVDIQLKRRHDLIPNLVETVKGYAAHEQAVLDRVVAARSQAIAQMGNPQQLVAQEGELVSALNGLMARVEAYPQLKASEHFLALQQELTDTEDRIAAARRFYNANVRAYNTMCDTFPTGLVAAMRSLQPVPYFEVDSVRVLQNVTVSFPNIDRTSGVLPGPPQY